VWKDLGSSQRPTPEQYKKLESAGQLQLLTSPAWVHIRSGTAQLQIKLPRQGLSLLKFEW
jgi:xylan 1,4-beta-xylosidase